MVGRLKFAAETRETYIRLKNNTEYERYINAIDQDYESEDAIFINYFYKINTLQFNLVNRSQYVHGCDFKHEIIEYRYINCFIPTKGYCFIKCITFLTGEDYKQQYLEFIRIGKRRSNIMTKARIQPFCRANINDIGCLDGTRVLPISVTHRNNALLLYNNSFV